MMVLRCRAKEQSHGRSGYAGDRHLLHGKMSVARPRSDLAYTADEELIEVMMAEDSPSIDPLCFDSAHPYEEWGADALGAYYSGHLLGGRETLPSRERAPGMSSSRRPRVSE